MKIVAEEYKHDLPSLVRRELATHGRGLVADFEYLVNDIIAHLPDDTGEDFLPSRVWAYINSDMINDG